MVIDAKEGIKENSKRHGHIVSMLGIKQVVVLVNKMDLVDFSKEVYEAIISEFGEFLQKLILSPLIISPSVPSTEIILPKNAQILCGMKVPLF